MPNVNKHFHTFKCVYSLTFRFFWIVINHVKRLSCREQIATSNFIVLYTGLVHKLRKAKGGRGREYQTSVTVLAKLLEIWFCLR